MEEPQPRTIPFEIPQNISIANAVHLLLVENGIEHDQPQQLRLLGLLEAFQVNKFRYYVRNHKIIIDSLNINFVEKKAGSPECKFANLALHDKGIFGTALLDPKILMALQNNRTLLANLVSDKVREYCSAKFLTPHDLCGFHFMLERYLKNIAFYSLLDSKRLTFEVFKNFSARECEQLLEVIKNQTVYDQIVDKKLTPQEALLLEGVDHKTQPFVVLREIERLHAQQSSEQPVSSSQNRDSCKCITM